MPTLHPATHAMRRRLLKLFAAGALTGVGVSGLVRQALAAGSGPKRKQGIYRLEGEATFNGKRLKVGEAPTLPLTVVTGANSLVVLVIGADAYLVRENSHVHLSASHAAHPSRADSIKLISGKLLSVFEKGTRSMSTATAVAGIRGTGIYMESAADRSYLCLCYGKAKLSPIDAPERYETFNTTHHESPRWVYPDRMEPAAMINHADEELILLESLTGRVPPFATQWGYGYGDGVLSDLARKRY